MSKIPDKDKPWTWKAFKPHFCSSCMASCCTMPVEIRGEDLVRLNLASFDELEHSPKKVAKRLEQTGWIKGYRANTGLFTLSAKPEGDCVFLDSQTRRCTVYQKRPQVCRDFPHVGPRVNHCPYKKKHDN